jgi:hypothetical protein
VVTLKHYISCEVSFLFESNPEFMRLKNISVWMVMLASLAFLSTCVEDPASTTGPQDSIIRGLVTVDGGSAPLSGVLVSMIRPAPVQTNITSTTGEFSFTTKLDSLVEVRLEFTRDGYQPTFTEVFLSPGQTLNLPAVRLRTVASDDPGGSVEQPVTGTAASITMGTVSANQIVVRESGALQQSNITFVVRDSIGRPINMARSTQVRFRLGTSPGGGELLQPAQAMTSGTGTVTTTLTSGTVSGVVQVVAELTSATGTTIRSAPVNLVIRSGLPDQNHFSSATNVLNVPGYNIFGIESTITAFVGDRYGNVVSPGTAVYFTTDGGLIEGAGVTDQMGRAGVTLMSALPRPSHPTLGPGFATIRARTADWNDQPIETTTLVLYSGIPMISASPTIINIPDGGAQTISYSVTDQNGNPLASGTKITVKVEGENTKVIGDVDVSLLDTQSRGSGTTQFQFTISDSDKEKEVEEVVQVTITAEGPNGKATLTLTGTTRKEIR